MQDTPVTTQATNKLPPKKEKRPPLTHFLCLPLVSETSLPLLENSLAEFKHSLLSSRKAGGDHPSEWLPPLFPDSAIRPLGTVHLTLGVMSLTSPGRLHEAVEFLESLDVDKLLKEVQSEFLTFDKNDSLTQDFNKPLCVSLESLGALPKAKAATVLYANPVDPTSRLHPFALKIRQAFVDAGFIEQDFIKQKPRKHQNGKQILRTENSASNINNNGDINGAIVAAEAAEEAIIEHKPKLRPLFLHATLVNTIYARGGRNSLHGNKQKKGHKHAGPLTFDARGLLARYRDYYADGTRMQQKQLSVDDNAERSSQEDNGDDGVSHSSEEEAHPSKGVEQIKHTHETNTTEYPFVWASNVPIERLCICEMGAKTLTEEDSQLAARLGQEYRVVAERKLF